MNRRILVAGVGNVFLGDDGFGVEVARRLAEADVPDGVEIADYGIRGIHLAYQLLDGYDELILIDAVPHGEQPGTITVLEPDLDAIDPGAAEPPDTVGADAHGMTPDAVFALLKRLGGGVDRALVVGCEPAEITARMGLSKVVAAAVEPAARTVLELLTVPAPATPG